MVYDDLVQNVVYGSLTLLHYVGGGTIDMGRVAFGEYSTVQYVGYLSRGTE